MSDDYPACTANRGGAQSQLLSCGFSGTEPTCRLSTGKSSKATKYALLCCPGGRGGGLRSKRGADGTGKGQDSQQQGERPLMASPRTRNQEEGWPAWQELASGCRWQVSLVSKEGSGTCRRPGGQPSPPLRRPVVAPGQCRQPAIPGT